MRRALLLTAAAFTLVTTTPQEAASQIEIDARGASIRFGGRVHTQFQASSVDDAAADAFVRRVRMIADVRVNDFLGGRVQPDFAGGGAALADAYVRMSFADALELSFGQFKQASSVFDLRSSTELPVIERDGRIAGLSVCPGVGGVCSFSRLTQGLGFDGRDVGVRLTGDLGGGFGYRATLTNGEGANARDVNDSKSFATRLEYTNGPMALGGFFASHDFETPSGDVEDGRGSAFGVDLEMGVFRDGPHLLAMLAKGDNWLVGEEADFLALQLFGSWYLEAGGGRLAGVEPLFRVSWADPDDETDDDEGLLLTPGLMLYVQGRNGVAANLDVYDPAGEASGETSFKLQAFLYF